MTERLYYSDAYVREFDATVTAVADDGRRVFLDRTAFYPTSGGQPFDTGMLGERRVVDVIDEGARIAHVLDAPLMQTTGTIHGRVDWPRRFDHMQQHTGQHLLSAVLDDAFGWKTGCFPTCRGNSLPNKAKCRCWQRRRNIARSGRHWNQ